MTQCALRTRIPDRANHAFTLVPADESVPDSVAAVGGRSLQACEFWSGVSSPSAQVLNAEDFTNQVKKMIGPFGAVHSIPMTNCST